MMKKILLTFAVGILLITGTTNAQTLHLINYCNTLDTIIGTQNDHDSTINEASLIASLIGYNIKFYEGVGENCSNERLSEVLNSLKCGKDDIILFYYSGHGGRSPKDKSEYPQMCLKYSGYEQNKWYPVHTVIEKLQQKSARFTLVLTDCCNTPGSLVTPKSVLADKTEPVELTEHEVGRYKKLFLESKGIVIATSSKKGQASGGSKEIGGLFTYVFWKIALPSAISGEIPATWNDILSLTSEILKIKQEPVFEIHLQPAAIPTQTMPQQNVTAVDEAFAKELSALLDKSKSMDWRMEQADYLAGKYFTADAKVATVARNGSTIIEYESAREFLRRIASSSFIKQVNIVKELADNQGKRTYLKVQEIRIKK